VYRRADGWIREFLRVEVGVSSEATDLLHEWARADQEIQFHSWQEAATQAAKQLAIQPVQDQVQAKDVRDLALNAARIVQTAMELTGSWRAGVMADNQRYIKECAETMLDLARRVPPAARNTIRAGDIAVLVQGSGSGRQIAPWQAPLILELLQHPILVHRLPVVTLAADSRELDESLLVRYRAEGRVSASARLDARVSGGYIHDTFTTNSGAHDVVLFTYQNTQNSTLTQPVLATTNYQAFNVTASADEQPNYRGHDAEKKILEVVDDRLYNVAFSQNLTTDSITGDLNIISGIRMCTSCYLVTLQFLTNFPNVNVSIQKQAPK
jgi:hypothetical protein